jgi:beta-glucosidase
VTGTAEQPARLPLPPGFVHGVAGSAYQLEGAATQGGRTPSLWDVFGALEGRVVDGSTGAVAVDHYHRWESDLELLAELGVGAYRMSLSWSRIQPHGAGPANPDGVAFYDRLIDRLLARGIAPFVGLHHWDMPIELMERGGWLVRETADAFAEYASLAAAAFGDRVTAWTTINEPLGQTAYGYALGIDAPGLTLLGGAYQATHHQLLAHGRAVEVLRADARGSIGIVNQHTTVDPASRSAADRVAARFFDIYCNRQFTDPVLLGEYPAGMLAMPGAAADVIHDGDLAIISAPLDFYGVSYSHPTVIAAAPDNVTIPFSLEILPGPPLSAGGWPVHPESLTRLLGDLQRRYPALPPVYVTGTGGAYDDAYLAESLQPDLERIAYLDGHLAAIAAAIAQGCDIRGYFHWSLLDSWEWAEGFSRRFGLVRVDQDTLDREPRASFTHFRDLIRRRPPLSGSG